MPRGSVCASRFGWSDVAFLVLVILVAGALNLRLPPSFHPGWFLLFLPIIVVIHEAGHAVASLLLGHRVAEVAIGAARASASTSDAPASCSERSRWPGTSRAGPPRRRASAGSAP